MSESFRVTVSDDTTDDLHEILSYIQARSPQGAMTLAMRFHEAIEGLATMPFRYREVGKSRETGASVRSLPVEPYIIYFKVEEDDREVVVLRVLHAKRRQPRHFE
jgi:toxin ParE1/3/4